MRQFGKHFFLAADTDRPVIFKQNDLVGRLQYALLVADDDHRLIVQPLKDLDEIFKAPQVDARFRLVEEIFTLQSKESILLDKRDYCLQMLQRIRDEAHRFAITFFRNIHSKRSLTSVLTEIPGVGKVKRRALIEKFGTIDRIMRADVRELAAVDGIGDNLAASIKKYFEEEL